MRCHTVRSSDVHNTCTGTATHMLIWSHMDEAEKRLTREMDPVCEPCGEEFIRRPSLAAMLVPLHIYKPDSAFIEIIEGHRLVKDPEHEARCFDCGKAGSPTWFKFQTNGCPGRPESITVLHYSREAIAGTERPAISAKLWWDYAVDYLHTHVEDWRLVTDHAQYSAFFTFRDREYGVRHNLPGGRFGAEKLPNRGRPEPEIINGDLNPYNQAVFYFHGRVTDSGSAPFATWTPDHADITTRQLVFLYAPEGTIREVLHIPGLRSWAETTGAICDAFGPISHVKLQTRIYEKAE